VFTAKTEVDYMKIRDCCQIKMGETIMFTGQLPKNNLETIPKIETIPK